MDGFAVYVPGETPLHKLDPRLKTAALAWVSLLMTVTGWPGLILATVGIAVLQSLSGLSWQVYRPVLLVSLWLFLFYGVAGGWVWTAGGHFWNGHWSMAGLRQAGFIVWRIFLLLILTRLFMAVTAPLEQGMAIAYYFNPLCKIIPGAGDFALLLTLTLRFIPLLLEEARVLWKARAVKGGLPEKGIPLILELSRLFPALLLVSLRRAEEVADNLIARGYASGRYRIINTQEWGKRDTWAMAVLLIWGIIIFVLR